MLSTLHRLSNRGSTFLDLVRGLSALAVMAGHLRGLFFVPFDQANAPTALIGAVYFLTSLGHQAVVVFFVLSGYFIAGNVLRSLADQSWNWRGYLTRRLVRLSIVLIPALLL